jgi:hypothetical protein
LLLLAINDLDASTQEEKWLNQLNVITIYMNRNRSMEQLHRQDQALIPTLTDEDSFDAVKRSPANAHAPPGTDESMRETRNVLAYCFSKTFDLFIRNRSSLPFISHEPKHTWRPQHPQPLFDSMNNADECITAEHRDFHGAPTVTPSMDLAEERKKRAYMFFFKLRSNPLFVAHHRLNGEPSRFLRSAI